MPCYPPESKPAVVITFSSLSPMPAATLLIAARSHLWRFVQASTRSKGIIAAKPGDLPSGAARKGRRQGTAAGGLISPCWSMVTCAAFAATAAHVSRTDMSGSTGSIALEAPLRPAPAKATGGVRSPLVRSSWPPRARAAARIAATPPPVKVLHAAGAGPLSGRQTLAMRLGESLGCTR